MTSSEGHVVQLFGRQDAATERLRQKTTVVADQNWQVRCQCVTDFQLGFREAYLAVGAQTAPLVDSRTVAVGRQNAAIQCTGVGATAAVKVNTDQTLQVQTKTNGALSEARQVVEFQASGRLTVVVGSAFAEIVVKIQGTRTDGRFTVFQKPAALAC